jgi:hypothetical protein
MPLPHDVWYHYYDRPCDFCEENIEMRDDDYGGSAECEMCSKLMCEECKFEVTCHVCDKKIEENEDFDMPDICEECMDSCEACDGVHFHPSCKEEHLRTCNPQGRAQRVLASAEDDVDDKKAEVARLEKELEAKKKALVEAEKKLQELKP